MIFLFLFFEELILKNIIFIFHVLYITDINMLVLIKQYEIFKFLKNNDLSLKKL